MPLDLDYTPGRPLSRGLATRQLPNLEQRRRRNVFRVVAHPESWEFRPEVGEGGAWLPTIKCLPLRPGVNGVTASNDGRLHTAAWDAGMAANGWIDVTFRDDLLDAHGVPDNHGDPTLVLEHDMSDGGKHYAPPWEWIGVRNGRTRKDVQADKMHAFQEAVAKVLGGMPVEQYRDRDEAWEAHTQRLRQDRNGGTSIERMIAWRDERREAMRLAFERQYPQEEKADKKAKPRRQRVERTTEVV